jgi:stearoyl-CoA desaturase (delta-9 desaturase)
VLEEGLRAEHARSVAAAQASTLARPEHASSLRHVLPAAAAIAVATVNAANTQIPQKPESAAHKDLTELAHELGRTAPTAEPGHTDHGAAK